MPSRKQRRKTGAIGKQKVQTKTLELRIVHKIRTQILLLLYSIKLIIFSKTYYTNLFKNFIIKHGFTEMVFVRSRFVRIGQKKIVWEVDTILQSVQKVLKLMPYII